MIATEHFVLGVAADFSPQYDPAQLCPIPRAQSRAAAGIALFDAYGEDVWTVYELSWLDQDGKPEVAVAEVRVPWTSPCLIESKSFKLYCNSLNMTRFAECSTVEELLVHDLSRAVGAPVSVVLHAVNSTRIMPVAEPEGCCLDGIRVEGLGYEVRPEYLTSSADVVRERVFSRLFRSRCPVTGQPDWATVHVAYAGPRIPHEGLLRYLVSYREHQGFHEACVEKIFTDIFVRCAPVELEVVARFTRRGGIDINPVRSTRPGPWENLRDPRQ